LMPVMKKTRQRVKYLGDHIMVSLFCVVGRLLHVEQETIYSVLKNTLRCKCGQQNYDRAGVAIIEVSWLFSP
jgi:hypothetical protein